MSLTDRLRKEFIERTRSVPNLEVPEWETHEKSTKCIKLTKDDNEVTITNIGYKKYDLDIHTGGERIHSEEIESGIEELIDYLVEVLVLLKDKKYDEIESFNS